MTLTQPSNHGTSLTMGNSLNTSHPLTTSNQQTSPLNLAMQLPQGASQSTHTFTVTNTNDSGVGSLRQAILNANTDSAKTPTAVDTINFNLGNGAHTITLTSAALDITAKNLTINGTGANVLTISGNNKLQDFTIEAGAKTTISGLTIANGFSATNNGGGILNNGTLTLNNSTLLNNRVNQNGGGIFNNGTLTANGDTFTNNTAPTSAGGAIFDLGTATITNSSFTGNSAVNGGAVECVNGTVAITNSTFTNNSAVPGGVGGALVNAGNGKLTVTGSSFTGNSVVGGAGAAIVNNNTSTLNVTNSSFTNNKAALGAAISVDSAHGATATALGLTFSGNVSSASNGTPSNNNDTFGSFTATVDTLQDTNDGNFSAGHLSLRNAINGGISGETIIFAPTLAKGTIVLRQGELAINKSLNIQGPGATQLTIDANHKSRDFNVAAGTNVSISGLTITNGVSGYNNFGGDIYNQGTLALSNDIVTGGTADLGGAGIFNNMGTLILAATTVSGNSGGNGAGLENIGGTATITGGSFIANASPNGLGGGISNSGTLNVTGTTFSQNTSLVGGGALFDNGTATIATSAFNNNSTNYKGGAILLSLSSGSVTVTGSSFSGNQAAQAANVPNDTPDVFGPVTFA